MSAVNPTQDNILDELIEKLAEIEHERWADWQKWCHQVLRENCPSPELEAVLERWDRQIATPYSELSEAEKQSDRDQVARYLPLLQNHINKQVEEAYRKGYNANARDCFCDKANYRGFSEKVPHHHLMTDDKSHPIRPDINHLKSKGKI